MERGLLGKKGKNSCPGASQHSPPSWPDPGTFTGLIFWYSDRLQGFFITEQGSRTLQESLLLFCKDSPPSLLQPGAKNFIKNLLKTPNLLHAPSNPSPGMAKLMKNYRKHFSVEHFPAQRDTALETCLKITHSLARNKEHNFIKQQLFHFPVWTAHSPCYKGGFFFTTALFGTFRGFHNPQLNPLFNSPNLIPALPFLTNSPTPWHGSDPL